LRQGRQCHESAPFLGRFSIGKAGNSWKHVNVEVASCIPGMQIVDDEKKSML
jgi:hypothetical protein